MDLVVIAMKNKTIQKTIGIVVLAILSVIIFSFLSGLPWGFDIRSGIFTEQQLCKLFLRRTEIRCYVFERNSGATAGGLSHFRFAKR